MRGLADDLALMDWLNHHIWPAELRQVSGISFTTVAGSRAPKCRAGGVTCFSDMCFFPRASACRTQSPHARGRGADCHRIPRLCIDAQTLNKGLRFMRERAASLARPFAPHAPHTVGDKVWDRSRSMPQSSSSVHMHIHETRDEIEQSLQSHGVRPLQVWGSLWARINRDTRYT